MITSLRLQNFRSYADASFEFSPEVNIIVGPNGSGKTNLMEAILVLARGSSYRAKDADLIMFDQPWARLDGNFHGRVRSVKLEPASKAYVIGGTEYKRLSLEKTVQAVYFEPNHLQLLTRGPEQRREYFDELLGRSQPGYKTLVKNYKRTLAQRNSLLKKPRRVAIHQLFAWNIRLSQLGSQIAAGRRSLADDVNINLAATYSRISKKRSKVELSYGLLSPLDTYASQMLKKLESGVDQDFERGYTTYGPHREDFVIFLNGQNAGQTASRGETRSLLLALKIYELGIIGRISRQKPIFLLDDVFSELDGSRRRALVANLKNHQTIITTTDAEAVLEYFSDQHNLIPL